MKSKPAQPVNKGACCRCFGWSRFQFDKNVIAGMPVIEAASHKGAEWRVDLRAVSRWIEKRRAEEAARRRRVQAYYEERRREAERIVQAKWEREQAQERARRAAERALEERCRREREERLRTKRLDRAYGACRKLAYEDYGSPLGAYWPNGRPRFAHEDHPQFVADWPFVRPAWWLPPPGMMAAIEAEPEYKPYNYQEPDWRQWVPRYVVGQHWPWRSNETEVDMPEGEGAQR
jgi:hypothetical protein